MAFLLTDKKYSDRYDRLTVAECRRLEKAVKPEILLKHLKEGMDESKLLATSAAFNDLHMYFVTGERYARKDETIARWMREDEERDRLLQTALPPENITCLTCGILMAETYKTLQSGGDIKKDRILFFFSCPRNHVPRRAFFDDGQEWKRRMPKCPACATLLEETSVHEKDAITTTARCTHCGHTETSSIDLTLPPQEEDPHFAKDRERFCLSDEEGEKYLRNREGAKQLSKLVDEIKEKEGNKELYEKVANLKKLKIIELEEMLAPILEKQQYIRLAFKDPEVTKDVIVPFTIYDACRTREGQDSSYDLKRLITASLKDTNWRLMSDGVNYRLGMLSGRLRAYEREEDLLRLVQKNEQRISQEHTT